MKSIEHQQLDEQKEISMLMWINTVATIATGVAATILAYLSWRK